MLRTTLTKDSRYRVILAFLVVITLICATCVLYFAPRADAYRYDTGWVTLDELVLREEGNGDIVFNKATLEDLYAGLNEKNEPTYQAVYDNANSFRTSEDIRSYNDGKNLSVYFGGLKWDATYLTWARDIDDHTKSGDIILTLWLADDTFTEKDKAPYNGWNMSPYAGNYPPNMYSTSSIRVVELNAGGKYTVGNASGELAKNNLSESHAQDANNKFARYTMDGVQGSLTKYISTPKAAGYQRTEFDKQVVTTYLDTMSSYREIYYFPNDSYEAPLSGGEWKDNKYLNDDGRADGALYGSWKDDYLWLPSATEVGFSDEAKGMWVVNQTLRKSSAYAENIDAGWLRSGSNTDQSSALYVHTSAMLNTGTVNVTVTHSVRPALHLNLSEINRSKPEAEYPPLSYTFELPDMVEFDPDTLRTTVTVDVSNVYVPSTNKSVALYVKSANVKTSYPDRFYVTIGDDDSHKMEYMLTVSGGGHANTGENYSSYGRLVWQATSGEKIASETLTITLSFVSGGNFPYRPTVAGTWTDELIFTAVVT